MLATYVKAPMRNGLFCVLDKSVLNLAGWNSFDDLALR